MAATSSGTATVTLPTDEQILHHAGVRRAQAPGVPGVDHEAMPDGEALDTLTLTEARGRTTITLLVQHTSKADRDAHVESGMEAGLQDGLDLLEQVAVSLR